MYWGRVPLLGRPLHSPVTAVFRLVWVKREVRLLRVVAVMKVEMRTALNGRDIDAAVSIVLRVWSPPHLALLGSSRSVILVGEAVLLVPPLCWPLLEHPCTLVWEVTVVPLSPHVVMCVMAASLGPSRGASQRWRLTGCPTVSSRLLYWSQYTFSYAMWRRVTPEMDRKHHHYHSIQII